MLEEENRMDFEALARTIAAIHTGTQSMAAKAVNASLTLRNWLIGAYIIEFEQRGEDRAVYGEQLIKRLSHRLRELGVPACEKRRLYLYRDFYAAYPGLGEALTSGLSPVFLESSPGEQGLSEIVRSPTANSPAGSQIVENQSSTIVRSPTAQFGASPLLVVERLSYTHLELLASLEDALKRAFYEIECIKGGWSVRELKRQIASLYFERSGLSHDKEALSRLANEAAEAQAPAHVIRDPYVFEFLDLRPQEVLPESGLESALIGKLQTFLMELGHGFCFEARQRRLVVGGEHFFIDLVFYHRVLKCHVLAELKVDEFRHEHLGQLNTYVSYYRAHEMTDGDQPPVGILLCTGKNHALVEYALAGMDNRLFVSRYQLELPKPEDLQRYLDEQRRLLEGGSA